MKFTQLLPVFIALFFSKAALADEKCAFSLACTNNGKSFSLDFKSVSGECTEDDMEATYSAAGQSTKLGIDGDWYFFTAHISKTQDSLCKDQQSGPFAAYAAGKDRMLLFIKSSGRPGFDLVKAVLLDTQKGLVIDKSTVGRTKNEYLAILKTKRGFKLRLIRDSLALTKLVTCDCDAAVVDDWNEVTIRNNKIASSWMKK